ncbi:MAG: alpha/beta hydrolase [Nitritalea sp.]
MAKRLLRVVLGAAILLTLLLVFGPRARTISLAAIQAPAVPSELVELERYIQEKEAQERDLKPDNEAKIIWADPENKQKTPYSMLYIHGFTASEREGSPVNRELAAALGANLYLARLPEHGVERRDAMEGLRAEDLMAGAKEALEIARQLGDQVVVVGTSMGGALSLVLAAENPDLAALILYSPAVMEYGAALDRLFKPWNKLIAKYIVMDEGGSRLMEREGDKAKYWSNRVHVDAYEALAVLLRSGMTEDTFKAIQCPTYLAYYYKDEENQDFVVSVPAMLDMFALLGTPETQKVKQAFPESGDHVIASSITSADWEGVLSGSLDFLKMTLPDFPQEVKGEEEELALLFH